MKLLLGFAAALIFSGYSAKAFSLIGPYTEWMDKPKAYRLDTDIGGPMNISEGYRWNMPILSYGFDRSFLDYFGSNGVAAVEEAMAVLNQLPPASEMDLQEFPIQPWRINFKAQALNLHDLKSQVLALMLEQLGLADPERFNFCIRDFIPAGSNYAFYVIQRNFDPITYQPSSYVNGVLFSYLVVQFSGTPSSTNNFCDAVEFPVDPLSLSKSTVIAGPPGFGSFVTNVSRDDAGGLRYLIGRNQVRYEELPADVDLVSASETFIRSAYRPGVEKISFLRHPYGTSTGEFFRLTNQWTDIYFDGDHVFYQEVQRVTDKPDFLFSARDLGVFTAFARSGTTNWSNNAAWNGNPGGPGPGVIQPPVAIIFNNVGPFYVNWSSNGMDESTGVLVQGWATFDGTTNEIVIYPSIHSPQPTTVTLQLTNGGGGQEFQWQLVGAAQHQFLLQTSTNLMDWETLTSITNSGAAFTFQYGCTLDERCRFFRALPNF